MILDNCKNLNQNIYVNAHPDAKKIQNNLNIYIIL